MHDRVHTDHIEEPKEPKYTNTWLFTPQAITSIIAIISIISTAFWTISDYRIKISNMETRLDTQAERILDIEKKYNDIDHHGTRHLIVVEQGIENMKKQLEYLYKIMVENSTFTQHQNKKSTR